jgi:GT2 family glycosyltransferase
MRYDPLVAKDETAFKVLEPFSSPPSTDTQDPAPEGFDESAYLEAFPDIATAIKSGEWTSALHHYRVHGAPENRLADKRYIRAVSGCTPTFPPGAADRVLVSNTGECLVSGWIFDSDEAPLSQIVLRQNNDLVGVTRNIARCRRSDAEKAEPAVGRGLLGFWALMNMEHPPADHGTVEVWITAGKERGSFSVPPAAASQDEFRDDALRALANAQYFGDPETETFLQLDKGLGESLIGLNAALVKQIAQGAYHARFGARRGRYLASVVVVLYGKADFLILQAALFSQCPGYDQYEFIYVSNSPELNDTLVKDAEIASRMYRVAITLVLLPGNAGFGVANNVAAAAAESDRILFLNPDVLPRERAWPRVHAEMVQALPATQTALFGVPLYYGDGSLMHGGMYIDIAGGCAIQNGRVIRREILRVEHYGKGAPPETAQYITARPVPAVTGAFMSVEREWFERLGGFSPEYIFGHYEDVDLCLRSLVAGTPAWLHNIPFWHLESLGSKRSLPIHHAARLVNRWRFTDKWGELVRTELDGRSPTRFAQ